MRRLWVAFCLAPLLAGAVAGCGGDAEETRSATTVRVLVRDINIRPVGVDCAGTGPYTHFHNRAPFRVEDAGGATLAEGALTGGRSVPAFEEDLEVAKVPTYCEFRMPVQLARRDAYRLAVDGRAPIPLTANDSEGPALVAVVPS
ncbi:hypothetical protein [Micromonospora siamensis]|uniref:Lipoprotein n=1 Tax=Micromonospora siamensis TaxID=299152 RepID=A0A1C5IR28_9ACTN|nr:hypothetical protein [Micromonospora siamensis]SCG60451.1 hypothetical protein GA0074704_3691 [Micromonospora siamensis]